MKRLLSTLALATLAATHAFGQAITQPASAPTKLRPQVQADYGKLPLSFEANQGQTDPQVRFTSRGNGYSLFLTDSAAVLSLSHPVASAKGDVHTKKQDKTENDVVRMELAGANRNLHVIGTDPLPGKANYFIGNDSSKWHTNVPTYAKVRYASVYPGIDLIYYGNQRQLEYDFVVAPGTDPKAIKLHFVGAAKLSLTSQGDLSVSANHGEIAFHRPVAYQTIAGNREPVEGRFTLLANNDVGFSLGKYDHATAVVIDPTLAYSTYLSGSNDDQIFGIAVDSSGAAYVTGVTSSTDFPVTQGSYQTLKKSYANAGFVAKLNPAGSQLVYATYLSGSNPTTLTAIALDSSGNPVVAGYTSSTDYPVMGAYQARNNGYQNVVLTKLNASGSGLNYSTYIGGESTDYPTAFVLDSSGNSYLAGYTNSKKFPVTSGAFQTSDKESNGSYTGFVAKLNSSGSGLLYATYLGGSSEDQPAGLAVDSSGAAYVDGTTYSTDFPVTQNPYQFTNKTSGNGTGFLSKINTSGTGLIYSTYLGGTQSETVTALAVDATGNAYVVGSRSSSNFPVTSGAYVTSGSGCSFITKMNSTGTSLVYSTFFGPNCDERLSAITLDSAGNAYLTGTTSDQHFPVSTGAFQSTRPIYNGNSGFFTILNPSGSALNYSTYYAGGSQDDPQQIVLDPSGNVYLAGYTFSNDFPTTTGAYQTKFKSGSYRAGFLGKFGSIAPSSAATPTFSPSPGTYPSTQTVTISDTTNGAAIYYTTDGTTPTTSSTKYTAAITVSATETIQAIAVASGYSNSAVASALYTISLPAAATPTFSPTPAAYSTAQMVTISDTTPNATIYYTLDGTNPTTSSTKYTGPISVTSTETILAMASASGYGNSAVATGTYTITTTPVAATPTFSPGGATYNTAQTVTISDTTSGATIYYTTNGSAPTTSSTKYTSAITVSSSETIQAIAVASGYTNSAVASATYTINTTPTQTAATPAFSPAPGSYNGNQTVTITDSTSGATIYYTTNGTIPTTSSTQYTGPVTISATETLSAVAVASGYQSSAVETGVYTITPATPDFALVLSSSSLTVSAGSSATDTVTFTTQGGFNQAVSLSCSGLPSNATCSFSPTTFTPSTSSTTDTLTVAVAAKSGRNELPAPFWPGAGGIVVALCSIGRLRRLKASRWLLVFLGAVMLSIAGIGCGGKNGSSGGGSTTSIVTVNATSGSLSHSTTFSLTTQ